MTVIPIRLAIAKNQAPEPQVILVLGGGNGREKFAAKFAKQHPTLEIWVSSGRWPHGPEVFEAAGIPIHPSLDGWPNGPDPELHEVFDNRDVPGEQQVRFGWFAADTVGDFAHHVKPLQERKFKHIYIITSADHMPRAKTIATLILGSNGITFTPVSVPSEQPKESQFWLRIIRDAIRSIIWIITGNPTNTR
ncbi:MULTISPECIES: YdcF family protein [unclassified Coleofasciculus]|uniref:YdcF family protein n=1 Tax=unclassified Coleofasciculus TaxID=2692782 RepID=UPI001D13FA0B|nr:MULTISPECIES: YdcF family protein [unclassified Coleofasciculus]